MTNMSLHHVVSSTDTTEESFKTFFKEESIKFLLYLQGDIYMGLTSEQLRKNDVFIFKEIALN